MVPERSDTGSSRAVETFFLTGDPIIKNIPVTPQKNTSKSDERLVHQKRDHRGNSFDYSHRNISFFFYENFCTDGNLLTRKFDIAHTGIPDNDHLGG